MLFHLKPLILALVMFFGYELIAYRWEIVFWVLGALLIVVTFGVNFILKSWRISGLPTLYFIGTSTLVFFVSGGWFMQFYIIVATAGYYLLLLSIYRLTFNKRDLISRRIEYMITLGVVFVWSASLFAIYLNRNIGIWVISLVLYAVVLLATRQAIETMVFRKELNYWLFSFIIAYCMGVLCWGMYFLPFGYLTLASLMLASYYILTNYIVSNLRSAFNRKIFLIDVAVFFVTVGLVLASARWMIFE